MHLELGEPLPTGSLDLEALRLTFRLGQSVYHSAGTSGWFEDELLDNKPSYLSVRGKADLFRMGSTASGFVQETDRRPEFHRRVPGSGYRR